MKTELLELKNLGNTSANWLRAVGIQSYEDLKAAGAVDAYIRVKSRGFKVSKVLLYALQGALMDVHWNELEPDLKVQLLDDVEAQLSETA